MTQLERNAAFENALATRMGMLRKLARRYIQNRDDAEDVLQDALLRAHQKLEQFRGEAHLGTWLGTIVINTARMTLRNRAGFRLAPEQEKFFFQNLADNTPGIDESLCHRECRTLVTQALRQLTPRLRTAYSLRLEGLSEREIGDALGLKLGTVKARLNRAKTLIVQRTREAYA